jgi:hypothetical protein
MALQFSELSPRSVTVLKNIVKPTKFTIINNTSLMPDAPESKLKEKKIKIV